MKFQFNFLVMMCFVWILTASLAQETVPNAPPLAPLVPSSIAPQAMLPQSDTFLQAMPMSNRAIYDAEYTTASVYLEWKNQELARQLIQQLKQRGWMVVTAESVTGGELAKTLIRCPGAGSFVVGGVVCYHIEAKRQLLGISDKQDSELYDHQTATDMALGAQQLYQISASAQVESNESYAHKPLLAIATSGRTVTYPGHWEGGTYIAVALPDKTVVSWYAKHDFINPLGLPDTACTKQEGILVATHHALRLVLNYLQNQNSRP